MKLIDDSIDFETMRTRIDFAFRVMTQTTRRLATDPPGDLADLNESYVSDFLSMVVTQSACIIYQRRSSKGIVFSDEEFNRMRNVAMVLVREFNALQFRIHKECSGLPITLSLGIEEGMIQEGVDAILNELKLLLNLHQ